MSFLKHINRHAVRIGLSLFVMVLLLLNTISVVNLSFVKGLENYTYDARLNLTMPATQDERIVIVDIDEKSLREQGHWPWSRHKLARLVDKLFEDYNINTLGFDVVFAEEDQSSGLKSLEQIAASRKDDDYFQHALAELRPKLDYDQVFASSLENRNVVLGYYFHRDPVAISVGELPAPSISPHDTVGSVLYHQANGYGANLSVLQKNAKSAGHFNPAPDEDGISRRIPALIGFNGEAYEALSLAVARVALGAKLSPGFAEGVGV
ncbi:MAG TPA: CHASE2 domain-containing protein, partial [Methylophilaceae bacterium]|nr:CHASE2 domain-containing protein [Methylophilaceae bacterium]